MKKLVKLAALGLMSAAVLGVSGCYCKGKHVDYQITPAVVTEPVVVEHHHHKLEKVRHEHVQK